MKFSILVPVYNVEQYLEECIQSILNQTYQDFELILVDDGSTDSSGKICDRFAKEHLEKIYVVHKQNEGSLAARITGITIANGEFCIFIDSDDIIEENLMATIVEYLNRDEELDILLYSFNYYCKEQKEARPKKIADDGHVWQGKNKKEIYEKIICTCDINSMCTKAIRTDILKADPTDYTLYYGKNMAEDLLQSLYPITEARKIMYVDKALYNYRMNEESISRSYRPETISKKNTLHVYEKILEYLPIWQLDNEDMREKLYAKWFNETMYTMSKYYEAAKTKADKQKIIDFNWEQMIPEEIADISNNRYVNSDYRKLYAWMKEKNTSAIDKYFFNKNCYQKWKKIKRKLKR